MSALPTLKLRVLPTFPSAVIGSGAITVTKAAGIYTIAFSIMPFSTTTPLVADYPTNFLLGYDSIAGSFFKVSIASLGGGVGLKTGSTYTYTSGDHTLTKKRSNAGAFMVDTLPGTGTGVQASGWWTSIVNADTLGILAIGVGSGATIDGHSAGYFIYLGPGQGATITSDGSNYFSIEKPARCRLGGATTFYYGGASSSDNNSGLSTGANAFANGQTAINFVRDRVDGNFQTVVIQAADATYTQALALYDLVGFDNGAWNPPSVTLRGNTSVLGNVTLNVTAGGANCVTAVNAHTSWFVEGFLFTTSASGNSAVVADYGATIYLGTNKFGACVANHIQAVNAGSRIELTANYTISGAASVHWACTWNAQIISQSPVVTITGTPAIIFFAVGSDGGRFLVSGATFSGAATGTKFLFDHTVTCSVNPATFPGSIAGAGATFSNSLGADVALNNTGTYFDGPSVAQGTTGTWFVSGTVTVLDTAVGPNMSAKLWDGTTVIASLFEQGFGAANTAVALSLSGVIAFPAGNLRISVKDNAATTGKIVFNSSGNSKDSTITAVRIG